MPRPSNHIQALDNRLQFNLTELKQKGFFATPHESGTLIWQWSASNRIELHLLFDLQPDDEDDTTGRLELRYEVHSGPVCQRIRLVRVTSNLGLGGGVWYALCPITGERCRTLYMDQQGFVSRKAIPGAIYRSQQKSKSERAFF